jgi:hypothetical protein
MWRSRSVLRGPTTARARAVRAWLGRRLRGRRTRLARRPPCASWPPSGGRPSNPRRAGRARRSAASGRTYARACRGPRSIGPTASRGDSVSSPSFHPPDDQLLGEAHLADVIAPARSRWSPPFRTPCGSRAAHRQPEPSGDAVVADRLGREAVDERADVVEHGHRRHLPMRRPQEDPAAGVGQAASAKSTGSMST